jgi:CelD/BcsL family acetyltransferase involved in cellulose biosynthesis
MPADTVRIVRTPDAWSAIAGDWDAMLRNLPGHTALQSYRFLSAWWRWLGAGRQLFIVLTEADGRAAGALPLCLQNRRIWGRDYRVLQFLGAEDELLRPALLFPDWRSHWLQIALHGLWEARHEWDLLELEEVVLEPGDFDEFQRFASHHGLLLRRQDFHPCPYLDLRQSWGDFQSSLSRKMRKGLRYSRRRLEKLGALRFEISQSLGDLETALATYCNIEQRSWKPAAEIGVDRNSTYRSFYAALLREYGATGQARILSLWLDDTPIAGTVSIHEDGSYYSLQIAHDQRYARYSPGTLLESLELEYLMQEQRFDRYEFMGGALTNKQRWTTAQVPTERLLMHQRDFRTIAFDWLYFRLKPRFRAVLVHLGLLPRN